MAVYFAKTVEEESDAKAHQKEMSISCAKAYKMFSALDKGNEQIRSFRGALFSIFSKGVIADAKFFNVLCELCQ